MAKEGNRGSKREEMPKFILRGRRPVREDELIAWAEWIEKNERQVA
jgi:hypothetical protein